MTSNLTFAQLAEANLSRVKRWHPDFMTDDDRWSIADWSNAMCGEAGELANVIKKIRRLETLVDPGPDDPPSWQLLDMAADELGDVIAYASLLAIRLRIDLGEAVRFKFNKVSARQGFPEQL